jgi:hypothetical protein
VATIENPSELCRVLREAGTIAVVGLSPKPERDSYQIARYFQGAGCRVFGINPGASEVLGEPCYPSLSSAAAAERAPIDLALVFRRPHDVPEVLEDAARAGLRRVWLQVGVSSPEAVARAEELGLELVADKCARTVHLLCARRPLGGESTVDG